VVLARVVADLARFVVDGIVFLFIAPDLVAWISRGRVRLRYHLGGPPVGYANRLIRLDFPEFSEPDDPIFVTIRNPRLVPPDTLIVASLVDRGDDQPVTTPEALDGNAQIASRLVVAWNVYDGTDDTDSPRPLGLPATPELVRKLPREIINRIMEEVSAAGKAKADPATPTSKTS
jgi:hypothetical protein